MTDPQKPDTIDEALYRYGTDFISHAASRSIKDIEEAGTLMLEAIDYRKRLQAKNLKLQQDNAQLRVDNTMLDEAMGRLQAENEALRKSLREMFSSFGTHEDSGNQAMFDAARAAMKEKP